MLTTLFTLYLLNTNISYPSEEYEVGSGQNEKEYYYVTDEPTTSLDNDTYFIEDNFTVDISKKKKGKKTKKNKKYRVKESEFSLEYEHPTAELSSSNIALASLGGIFVITGMILILRSYYKRRGYQMIPPNIGVSYGSMDNIYNGE